MWEAACLFCENTCTCSDHERRSDLHPGAHDRLAGYWLDGTDETDGTDGLDGALVGRGWDGPTLAPAGTGAPPLAPEQECHHWLLRGDGLWEVVAGTNCVGAARAQIICVGAAKNTNRLHTNWN